MARMPPTTHDPKPRDKSWQGTFPLGSLAALLQALAYVLFLVLVVGVIPAVGGVALTDYTDPATMLQKESIATSKVEMIFLTIVSLVSGDGIRG